MQQNQSKLEQLDHVRLVVEELSQETEALTVKNVSKDRQSLDDKIQRAKEQAEEKNKTKNWIDDLQTKKD